MSICWLRTNNGTAGPSELVSNYFVSHTDIIKTPQHNLFTARRWSVGSAHLPHWNNCCDDRLCWEHVQAWENKHHFWLEVLETEPSWRTRNSNMSPVQSFRSSDQFSSCALSYRMSKGFYGIFLHRSTSLSNVFRDVSKCCTAGSKRCCFDPRWCDTFWWTKFHFETLSLTYTHWEEKDDLYLHAMG